MSKTLQEQFDEALACTTRAEADAWLEREIAELMAAEPERCRYRESAVRIIRANLGYWTGYSNDPAVWQQIYDLFDAEHPFFGTPAMRAKITPEDAFAAGQRWAEQGFPDSWRTTEI